MARFLFVVPPLTGHVNPTVAVALELRAMGHRVAWVAHPTAVRPLLPEGAELIPLDDRVPLEQVKDLQARARAARGLASLKVLWEDFLIPLARSMVEGVTEASASFAPDVMVVDQQALAGSIVAQRKGMRWATMVTTSAGITDPLAALPKVRGWVDAQMEALRAECGVSRPLDRSDALVLVFSTEALVGGVEAFPPHFAFVGPALKGRADATPFPWQEMTAGPKVLVSLGTVNAERGARFYRVVCDALEGAPLQVILVAPSDLVERIPPNFIVRSRVPQLDLLAHVDLVVSHGGHNTVCESLAHGVPLVVAPITDDQPVVAEQVVRAGAGLRVRFGRVRAEELDRTIRRVLEEPEFRRAARRIQRSFAAAGGAAAAALRLAQLASSASPQED